jgi:EAL domain-containing protein (putative c-di-GMP-specific phosphodiesterase class I)
LDGTSEAVVSAITSLSHALGKRVIAEWVEDEATASRLALLGVDYGQGYFWSHPIDLNLNSDPVGEGDEARKTA